MDSVLDIIKKFMVRFDKSQVEGILLFGSAVSGRMTKKSDIDLIVVKDEKYSNQEMGCKIIDGIKVEYFVYGINYIYDLAYQEIERNDPSHLTKFITSKIIYDKTGKFGEVVDKIRKLYDIPIRETHDNKIKKQLWHIKNRIDDLESIKNDDNFYIVYYDILSKIRDLYILINGCIYIPLAKTEKLFKDDEYLSEYIKSDIHRVPTKKFMEEYLDAQKLQNPELMIESIDKLYNDSFENEKFDPDNFELLFDENNRVGI